jgi:hypothetical protein
MIPLIESDWAIMDGNISHLWMGILLLAFGRRLFWFFVGAVGFVSGFELARQLLAQQPYAVILGLGLLCGLAGILLAIFFQRLAVGLGGFAAGGLSACYLAAALGLQTALLPAIWFAGGIIGAVLLYLTFDWTLIVLSSFAGASLIMPSIHWPPLSEALLYGVLIVLGVGFQALWLKMVFIRKKRRFEPPNR